jgi:hypothetical protein
MARVIAKGVAVGCLTGLLLFELLTGVLFFSALGSGRSLDFAGAFVVTVRPNGAFNVTVGPGYLVGLLLSMVGLSILVTVLLARTKEGKLQQR